MEHLVAAEGVETVFSGQLDTDTISKYSADKERYCYCVGCGACICAECLGKKFTVGRIDVEIDTHPKRRLSAMV